MLGLRTQENEKFKKFFALVQSEANLKGGVFFLDNGQGNAFENEDIECEDLCGWLIPKDATPTFEKLFENKSKEVFNYDDYYCYVDFSVDNKTGKINIVIDETKD